MKLLIIQLKQQNRIWLLFLFSFCFWLGQAWGQTLETWSGTVAGKTYTTNTIVTVTGDVTLTSEIVVKGCDFELKTDGYNRKITRSYGGGDRMFNINPNKESGNTFTINGNGATLTIDGGCVYATEYDASSSASSSKNGLMIHCRDANMYMTNVIMQNGYNSDGPGAIRIGNPEKTTTCYEFQLTNVVMRGLKGQMGAAVFFGAAPSDGGVDCHNVLFENVEIYGCYSTGKEKTVEGTTTITEPGGTIKSNGSKTKSTVVFKDCYIHDNKSEYEGGGIYWDATGSGSSLTINNCIISDNIAMRSGGGMRISGASTVVTISNSEIARNTARKTSSNVGAGAGICIDGSGTVNLNEGTKIHHNEAVNGSNYTATTGGGIYIQEATLNLNGAEIIGNKAGRGAGIYVHKSSTLNLLQGSIADNHAIETTSGGSDNNIGGGLHLANGQTYTINVGAAGSGPLVIKGNSYTSKTGVTSNIDLCLQANRYINITGPNFNPQDMFVYTTGTDNNIDIFYSSNTTYLSDAYDKMTNGTTHLYPGRENYTIKEYTSGNYISFTKTSASPWSSTQQGTTTADLHDNDGDGVYEIANVKELTAFLWYVNGISKHIPSYTTAHPSANGKLMADISMTGQYWVPIDNYTGTFDGNGYSISNLSMERDNPSDKRGLFGTVLVTAIIKNVQLHNCTFNSGRAIYLGLVAADNGGTIKNCNVDGQLIATSQPAVMGGLAGKCSGSSFSSYAKPVLTSGSTMGGLVGENALAGFVYNSFANVSLTTSGTVGGLVGYNNGFLDNSYIIGTTSLVGTNSPILPTNNYIQNCYAPSGASSEMGDYNGTYSPVVTPYAYGVSDNKVTTANATYNGKSLVETLNNYGSYDKWGRPTTTTINGDYPVLKMAGYNAVASNSEAPGVLYYGDINTWLTNPSTDYDVIYLYGSKAGVSSNSGSSAKLIIDEDAAITQAGAVTATVGVTLKNTQDPLADSWDWHMFSSALTAAPLGVTYNGDAEVAFAEVPKNYAFNTRGYFPSTVPTDYDEIDFYCYYEPEYHWINFKRNSNSHWHQYAPTEPLDYMHYNPSTGEYVSGNEDNLIPGKGYLMALKKETLLQATGQLNNTNVTIGVTKTGEYRTGYNLIGNPYQSFYDFNDFATDNATLWSGGLENSSYILLSGNSYRQYAYGASANPFGAGRYLHPHQGFMVIVDGSATQATFSNAKRIIALPDGASSQFRDGEWVNYPLVNLIATGEDGKYDLTTVELGRPDKGGARKAYDLHQGKGCIYTHYEGGDYSIAFTQPGITEVGVRFEADEEATFTMTWDTENGTFTYLHLIDNMMGADIDCLKETEYRFSATPDDYKSRFRLVFGYTGIEEPEEDGSSTDPGTNNFAFQMGNELVVNGDGTLQVVDMMGRLIETKELHGTQSRIQLPTATAGIYLLRLVDKNGMRVQKIMLK